MTDEDAGMQDDYDEDAYWKPRFERNSEDYVVSESEEVDSEAGVNEVQNFRKANISNERKIRIRKWIRNQDFTIIKK